ncbi:MAG: wax ester/triacylglycerol synthase family O-acyltransferase [Chloroflexi bacterium AL-W]|nr:wax ester/triacylglycerol synthase family O-acyltransferase [Chloroflexi bacterium AL-N1]NOK67310.1 wax ester/triacylglycerol synthase family O-acyltransferase [Chloroflexi bacterium AL-N10]NOK75196.1 wax ester/triacylglycerol synthase family O-acyltransferase [Chloroflexi bacterium AL-N5]NOK81984.1 wax ester/triacylglycerol synthase family O-acyltransferase [Chloroflexi bacterium AL-W]NOK89829.1 wax ester/triacylglycerol synthase family O-acyltransferase [Chloroflexi bacterium AL-N15]
MKTETLSPVDAAWLHMEDPTNLMMVTTVLMFDEVIDFELLKTTIEHRLLKFDRFRQRVVDSKQPFSQPQWEPDPHFTLSAHLHRIALPAPGDQAMLEEMVSDLMSAPLDATKPLWQFHLIENYNGGCALLMRIHHCIADGIALVQVVLSLTDATSETSLINKTAKNKQRQGAVSDFLDQATAMVNSTIRTTETLLFEGIETIIHPSRVVDLAKQGAMGAVATGKLAFMGADAQTAFKGKLGVTKRAAWSTPIPLAQVKAISHACNGTINDVLMTAVTGALRRYLQGRDETINSINIRAVIPVNLRPPKAPLELGNKFGLVFLELPIGIEDVSARFIELKKRMDAIKNSPEALVAFGLLNTVGAAPSEIERAVVDLFATRATTVMTNVPGPRDTIYLAGKAMSGSMFWVPQAGRLGLGVSILSYAGAITLGIAADVGLIPDPKKIIDEFHAEFEQLMSMAQA